MMRRTWKIIKTQIGDSSKWWLSSVETTPKYQKKILDSLDCIKDLLFLIGEFLITFIELLVPIAKFVFIVSCACAILLLAVSNITPKRHGINLSQSS